jgi:hypothetical protein
MSDLAAEINHAAHKGSRYEHADKIVKKKLNDLLSVSDHFVQ